MLDFVLKLLSFLGIILLVLVLLLLAALLLVLFFPVTYRIRGRKTAEKTELSAGLNWLFGLLRVRCSYPEPGILTVKLLWFKLYQTKLPPDGKDKAEQAEEKAADLSPDEGAKSDAASKPDLEPESGAASKPDLELKSDAEGRSDTEIESDMELKPDAEEKIPGEPVDERKQTAPEQSESNPEEPQGGFFEKFKKIKYTICSLYDKIKEIWKNISYYTALLQEEDTRQLWAYAKLRAAKILKNIRPRHIRADILFGTGSPDTTGYVFGMYCMFYPSLGAGVLMTPDFERAVLEGRLDISGHITVFVLVVNVVRLMMDKKLRMFIKKLKKEEVGQDKALKSKAPGGKASQKDKAAH